MFKKLLTVTAMLCAASGFAAVDVNTATEAELDGVRGIGPGLSGRILQERKRAPFEDWRDFVGRVGGIGHQSAVRLSGEGLTVNGRGFSAPDGAQAGATSQPRPARGRTVQREAHGMAQHVADPATPADRD